MSERSSGLGFMDVLAIVFIVLKLVGVITWSWIWVLSPIWIGLLLFMFLYGIAYGERFILWISVIITLTIIFCLMA